MLYLLNKYFFQGSGTAVAKKKAPSFLLLTASSKLNGLHR